MNLAHFSTRLLLVQIQAYEKKMKAESPKAEDQAFFELLKQEAARRGLKL